MNEIRLLGMVVDTPINLSEVGGSVSILQTCGCSECYSIVDFEIPINFGG